jgi:hypothetical protein
MSFTAAKNWGSFATAQLPNKSGATVQSAALQVGDTAYDTTNSVGVVVTDATLSAAVYAALLQGSAGVGGTTQLHDTTHAPVALWQLNNNYLDTGTTGENLTLEIGTTQWFPGAVPNTLSPRFDNATRLVGSAVAPAALRILGDITVEALIRPGDATTPGTLVNCSGASASETEANNTLWDLRITDQDDLNLQAFWESGAGVNSVLSVTDQSIHRWEWSHVAFVRDASGGIGATIARLYINGRLIGTATTLNPATGGTTSRIRIAGFDAAGFFLGGTLASVKVIAGVLTTPQIQDEVRRTVPRQLWGF